MILMTQTTLEHQAYDTHLNYIKCLSDLVKGVSIKYTGSLKKAGISDIDEKKNLISLTKKSLNDEYKIVQMRAFSSTSKLVLELASKYLFISSYINDAIVVNSYILSSFYLNY